MSSPLWDLLLKALGAIAAGVTFAGFVAAVGGGLIWIRFSAAGLPADQAVSLVAKSELVAVGLATLIPFTAAALAAIFLLYLVDPTAHVHIGAETQPAMPAEQTSSMTAAMTIERGEVSLAVSEGPERELARSADSPGVGDKSRARTVARRFLTGVQDAWGRAAILIALEMLAFYSVVGFGRGRLKERIVGCVVLAAMLLFLGAIAHWSKSNTRARLKQHAWIWVIVAMAPLAIFITVAVNEPKLTTIAWFCALGGAIVSLGIAAWTQGFRWFAVTAFFAISAFGGIIDYVRTLDSPKVQPAAVLLKQGNVLTGLYVAESDSRIYLGEVTPLLPVGTVPKIVAGTGAARKRGRILARRINGYKVNKCLTSDQLAQLPGRRLPGHLDLKAATRIARDLKHEKGKSRSGRIFSVDRSDVMSLATGPPQSICSALARAPLLGAEMVRERTGQRTNGKPT